MGLIILTLLGLKYFARVGQISVAFPSYDITFDGMSADLKRIDGGAGNIVKYIQKALTKQGAKAVILQLPSHESKYYTAINEARRKYKGKIYFYFADEKTLKEIK